MRDSPVMRQLRSCPYHMDSFYTVEVLNTAELPASAPVLHKNNPHMGPEILYNPGAGEEGQSVHGNFSLQQWW